MSVTLNQAGSLLDKSSNPALFGCDPFPGLVALWMDEKAGTAHLWQRHDGVLRHFEEAAGGFFWVDDVERLAQCELDYSWQKLEGDGLFRYLVSTETWPQALQLSRAVSKNCGVAANSPNSPLVLVSDPAQMYLTNTGRTFYGGMDFSSVLRLTMAVRAGGRQSDLEDLEDEPVQQVALCWGEAREDASLKVKVLDSADFAHEAGLLEALSDLIAQLDPDNLEGHDLFCSILPYLESRYRLHNLPMLWSRRLGEDWLPVSHRSSRLQVAEKTFEYVRWEIPGRELTDTRFLAILHDVTAREMESYDLSGVADCLNMAQADLAGSSAAKDCLLTREIFEILGYSYFLQARIFPYNWQSIYLRGNATRINSLFLREYKRRDQALPPRPVVDTYAGGLTRQDFQGLMAGVCHCDIQSLYPSIMVSRQVAPEGDSLGVFLEMLSTLREFRLRAKARQREFTAAHKQEEARFYGALQTTFKILINSFYGYLGFPFGNFADCRAAATVTETGRNVLLDMIAFLQKQGAAIIEVDTDGIYFAPPRNRAVVAGAEGASWQEAGRRLTDQLNAHLPEGINVELDGLFPAMYCHKMKNYALLDENNQVILRGSGLRSRAMEPYLRITLRNMLALALSGRKDAIADLFNQVAAKLKAHALDVNRLAKTETLNDSPEKYQIKIAQGGGNRRASYELALSSGRNYRAGDSVSYYITGTKATVKAFENSRLVEAYDPAHPDENVKYYLAKLKDLHKKFAPILGLEAWKG